MQSDMVLALLAGVGFSMAVRWADNMNEYV